MNAASTVTVAVFTALASFFAAGFDAVTALEGVVDVAAAADAFGAGVP